MKFFFIKNCHFFNLLNLAKKTLDFNIRYYNIIYIPFIRRHFVRWHCGRRRRRLIVGGQCFIPGLLVRGQHYVHRPGPKVVGCLSAIGVQQLCGWHGHHFFRFAGRRGFVDETRVHACGPVTLEVGHREKQIADGRRVHDVVDRKRFLSLQFRRRNRSPPVALGVTFVRRRQFQCQRTPTDDIGRRRCVPGRRRRGHGEAQSGHRSLLMIVIGRWRRRLHSDCYLTSVFVLVVHVLAGRRRSERPLAESEHIKRPSSVQRVNTISRHPSSTLMSRVLWWEVGVLAIWMVFIHWNSWCSKICCPRIPKFSGY